MNATLSRSSRIALILATVIVLSGCGSSQVAATYSASGIYSTTSTGCIPLGQTISFYGSGLQIDAAGNLYGGKLPSSTAYGSISVGSYGSAISGTVLSGANNGSTLQLGLSSATGTYATASSSVTVSGTVLLSSYAQQYIQSYASQYALYGTSAYSTLYGSSLCVSGIAIQGSVASGTGRFYGNVYFYLNGTTQGVYVTFQ